MGESTIFGILLLGWFALAAGMAIVLSVVTAPYGRHVRRGWGPTMGNRLGWVIMEAPAPLVFGFCFVGGTYRSGLTAWVFLLMWQAHYVHRAFIYPFSLHSTQARMPLLIVDGKPITWEELGRMVVPYAGFRFKLDILDRSEEK